MYRRFKRARTVILRPSTPQLSIIINTFERFEGSKRLYPNLSLRKKTIFRELSRTDYIYEYEKLVRRWRIVLLNKIEVPEAKLRLGKQQLTTTMSLLLPMMMMMMTRQSKNHFKSQLICKLLTTMTRDRDKH